MKITLHNPSIADQKKTLFFSDHSSGEIYRQNEDRDIVKLLTIFHDKTPNLLPHEYVFFCGETKQKWVKNQETKGIEQLFFRFEYTQKNISHENPIWHKK